MEEGGRYQAVEKTMQGGGPRWIPEFSFVSLFSVLTGHGDRGQVSLLPSFFSFLAQVIAEGSQSGEVS